VRTILLLLGALPFAIAAWWSIAAPLTGLLIVLFGLLAFRAESRRTASVA
jgi:hypothetical protein